MLSLSAIVVSLLVLSLLLATGPRDKLFQRTENFNKLATALAISIAAVWLLIQDRDATRLSITTSNKYVIEKDIVNMFSTISVKNDGDTPVDFRHRPFALWVDSVFPVGNDSLNKLSQVYKNNDISPFPSIRLNGSKTISTLIAKGHFYYDEPNENALIKSTGLPSDVRRYFYDDLDGVEDELQPGATSSMIFWTPLSCKTPGVYVVRFELEANRSWYNRMLMYVKNGFKSGAPIYSIDQSMVDLTKECKELEHEK